MDGVRSATNIQLGEIKGAQAGLLLLSVGAVNHIGVPPRRRRPVHAHASDVPLIPLVLCAPLPTLDRQALFR